MSNNNDGFEYDDDEEFLDMSEIANESSPRQQSRGIPNPNEVMQPMQGQKVNYQSKASSGARVTNGVEAGEINGYGSRGRERHMGEQMPEPGSRPRNNNQNRQRQQRQRQPMNTQQMQQNNPQVIQNPAQSGFAQNVNQRPVDPQAQQMQQSEVINNGNNNNNNSKKPKIGTIVIIIALIAVIGVVAVKFIGNKQEVAQVDYSKTGKGALDSLQEKLNNYDAIEIDDVVGKEDGDSYIAQEWAYVNQVQLREEMIKRVCGLVSFKYPQVPQVDTKGRQIEGSTMDSTMENGEEVTVTIPDYEKLITQMDTDKLHIESLYEQSGIKDTDYDYVDKFANLYAQYFGELKEVPTKEVQWKPSIKLSENGTPYIETDDELDDYLFASEEAHNAMAKFSQVALKYTGKKMEKYIDTEEQKNPEYKKWYKLFNKYYEADKGHFHKGVSKWEPWYKRDKNNKILRNSKGEKIVNYYSVKKKDGTDWIEPAEYINVKVEKEREVDDPWVEETGIMYNWLGTNYIQNHYEGTGDTFFRVGDGTKQNPAGIGTTIITHALCTDGKFHDVKVALMGYWKGQDAINYCESFDTRNRGFIATSAVSLICYEVQIENLENKTIEVLPEMTLADSNSNVSQRTGTMYGFVEKQKIKPHEKKIINDWATSTEIDQKYVCWGKSFARDYAMVYFNILAGSGKIPPYSAYEFFTGKSTLDENVEVKVTDKIDGEVGEETKEESSEDDKSSEEKE